MNGEPDFGALRLLVVAAKTHAALTLRTVLGVAGAKNVTVVASSAAALDLLCRRPFDAVFCDEQVKAERTPFALAARRTPALLNPLIPIFSFSETPRRRMVEAERDRGVTDVIALPANAATVARKLRSAFENPRTFIKAGAYFGPDRRGEKRPPFEGQERRTRTPRRVRISHDRDTVLL